MNASEINDERQTESAERAAVQRVLATLLLMGAAVTAILFGLEASMVALIGVGLFVIGGSSLVLANLFRR